jgi:glycine hydroxymethyltransferase
LEQVHFKLAKKEIRLVRSMLLIRLVALAVWAISSTAAFLAPVGVLPLSATSESVGTLKQSRLRQFAFSSRRTNVLLKKRWLLLPRLSVESSTDEIHLSSTADALRVVNEKSEQTSEQRQLSISTQSLQEQDPVLAALVQQEERRQAGGLELIASENFCSPAVRAVLGSCLTNKYSEGLPNKRYYGGNQFIDQIELLCMERALDLFQLDSEEWGVNVQPYSGSPANFCTYTALLQPHDRIMGLDLPAGGHLTHGYRTMKGKKVSATSIYFESMPYTVDPKTGYIDYDDMQYRAQLFLPKLLIAGGSAYPREWDYARMKQIADSVGAMLMVDMAHISGLVAAKVAVSPFPYADVVTSTTHKTLRGPRSGVIFARSKYMDAINAAVFPALQGGPHNHQIGALAVALLEAKQPEFQVYAQQIIRNACALASALQQHGHVLATNGTDNHLLLWNVRASSNGTLTGSKLEKIFEMAGITTNKNSIAGDSSALNPGGIRLGTPALTTRGLVETDFEYVADLLHRGYQIALEVENVARSKKKRAISTLQDEASPTSSAKSDAVSYKDYLSVLERDASLVQLLDDLRVIVERYTCKFHMP